jgi:acyl-CoA thioesterase
MASAALAAASAEGSTHLHATSVSTNYMQAPTVGPAELVAEVRRVGRAVSFVHVTMIQDDVVTTESLVTLGSLGDSAIRYADAPPPDVARIDQCRASPVSPELDLTSVIEQRLDPAYAPWREGGTGDVGDVRSWLRLDDGDGWWDPWSLLFATDAMPPATFALGSTGWVPTLQLTSYVRRIPVGEWLRGRQWCVVIADGFVDERCELFDERGELVASSSQLAMVRFPSGVESR